MKTLSLIKKQIALVVILLFTASLSFAQPTWFKAYNTGYWYHTNDNFTWSGGARDGYCDGFGTIQWYDQNGNPQGKYIGQVKYGKNVGFGTQYLSNGEVYYRGNWVDDQIEGFDQFNTLGWIAGRYLMNNVFDGGVNLNAQIIKLISVGNSSNEIKIRVTFNGNIFTSNFYAFTIVVNGEAPYVHFENVNDMASIYLTLKVADKLGKYLNNNGNNK